MQSVPKGVSMKKATDKVPSDGTDLAPSNDGQALEVRVEDAVMRILGDKVAAGDLPELSRQISQVMVSEQFSGPMPHPRHLRDYDEILPGAAERLMSMAETNLHHFTSTESKALNAEISDRRLGMWLGAGSFTLLVTAGFGAIFVASSPLVPLMFLGAASVGGVTSFIKGRNGQ